MPKSSFQFTITASDPQSNARTGLIQTTHGTIRTPGFVAVGTAATVKSLTPEEIKSADIDVFFVNTYHMLFRPGTKIVKKAGGLHRFMNWTGPIMTDSGGFQAFSLGDHGPRQNLTHPDNLVKITDNGIRFKSVWDGSTMQLGPRESIRAQQDLGSDIMMAFDECTFYPVTKDYAKKAMERTHRWALLCLDENRKKKSFQSIYGIVQGSVFKDLRVASAHFMANQPFEGYAIGSV
ncbi:MAG: tRNA guanosine(34) transglycosylase Tgt, partial [Bacteroidota bacterium]